MLSILLVCLSSSPASTNQGALLLEEARSGGAAARMELANWLHTDLDVVKIRRVLYSLAPEDRWVVPVLAKLAGGSRAAVGEASVDVLWRTFPKDAPEISRRLLRDGNSAEILIAKNLSRSGYSDSQVVAILERECYRLKKERESSWGIMLVPCGTSNAPQVGYVCALGPAGTSELLPGDVLVAVNELKQPKGYDFPELLEIFRKNNRIVLQVRRGDSNITVVLARP